MVLIANVNFRHAEFHLWAEDKPVCAKGPQPIEL